MGRALRAINILLLIVAAFLLMTWIFSGSTTGFVSYSLSSEEPKCKFISSDDYAHDIENLDLCCFEIQKMLKCEEIEGDFDYVCYNLKEGNRYYINSKTFNYCLKEGYDIRKAT